MKEVYIKIKGRVQGIGFRRWAVNKAKDLDISGWVHNEADGSVTILMGGSEANIDDMLVACHKGPMFARVDKVEFVVGRLSSFMPPLVEGAFRQI